LSRGGPIYKERKGKIGGRSRERGWDLTTAEAIPESSAAAGREKKQGERIASRKIAAVQGDERGSQVKAPTKKTRSRRKGRQVWGGDTSPSCRNAAKRSGNQGRKREEGRGREGKSGARGASGFPRSRQKRSRSARSR